MDVKNVKSIMKSFNVINYDCNKQKFIAYDIIPYLKNCYQKRIDFHHKRIDNKYDKYFDVPVTFDEFRQFVKDESMYQFWGRCEYEIILVDWPCQKYSEKWDVYQQIMMNLDSIVEIIMKECNSGIEQR